MNINLNSVSFHMEWKRTFRLLIFFSSYTSNEDVLWLLASLKGWSSSVDSSNLDSSLFSSKRSGLNSSQFHLSDTSLFGTMFSFKLVRVSSFLATRPSQVLEFFVSLLELMHTLSFFCLDSSTFFCRSSMVGDGSWFSWSSWLMKSELDLP